MMMRNKKNTFLLFSLLAVLTIGFSTTFAYLTSKDQAVNKISVAEVTTDVPEDFDPKPPKPGVTVKKVPAVANGSDVPVFVRASVRFSNSDMEELTEPLSIMPGWSDGGDGFYYYAEQVPAGGKTGPLFTEVKYRNDVSQEQLDDAGACDILVYAESVQAYGRTAANAWDGM